MPFYEHVFLDDYLDRFPRIEPIQQFMTLVLNGISQNSFLNLKEKKEIIEWYYNYFNDKLDLINESLQTELMQDRKDASSFSSNVNNRSKQINHSNSSKILSTNKK